jgi:hypothetical protein
MHIQIIVKNNRKEKHNSMSFYMPKNYITDDVGAKSVVIETSGNE